MADVNPPRDASAPEILAALRGMEAELAAVRSEVAAAKAVQVKGGAGAPGGVRAAPQIAQDTGALERENAVRSRGLAQELQMLDALKAQTAERQRALILPAPGYRPGGGGAAYFSGPEAQRAKQAADQARQQAIIEGRALAPVLGPQSGLVVPTRFHSYTDPSQTAGARELEALQRQEAAQLRSELNRFVGAPPRLGPTPGAQAVARGVASPVVIQSTTADLARLGQVQAAASQQMRRHGALTTEFLSALARGETTLAEFRFQIGATIAKFGGWTAAAASVYGVIGLIKELGSGATESASGVATLSRFFEGGQAFDTSKAQQGFRNVSREANVGIKDVAEAQAAFARVFKNQDDSLTAARVSIIAYKLDQISAANSQRYFTAIVQEWGLSAKDLPLILDQVAAAQRRLGARTQEVLPAFARSSAAIKNTGGDINQLIALLSTAIVSTGQTGNVVGTAFSRAASNFYRKPANAEILKSFGLDSSQGFTQFLFSAIAKASTLSGQQRSELARAIGGPQFGGRVFQTLLGQQDRLQKAARETSPGAAAGTTAAELAKQLGRVDEQLHKVLFGLQRLGGALAQSGAFAPLGIALKTLNLLLGTVDRLAEAFANLPTPLRRVLTTIVEIGLAMRVLRSSLFGGLGEATGLSFIGPTPAAKARKEQVIGTRAAEATSAGLYEATTVQAAQARARGVGQLGLAAKLDAQAAAITATDTESVNLRAALLAKAKGAREEAVVLEGQGRDLEAQALVYREQELALTRQRVALQKGTISNQEVLATQAALAPGRGSPGAGRAEEGAAAAALAAQGKVAGGVEETARSGRLAGLRTATAAATARALSAGQRLEQGAIEVRFAAQRLGAGMLAAVSGMGLLGGAFTALIVGSAIFDEFKRESETVDKLQVDYGKQIRNAADLARARAQAQQNSQKQLPFLSRAYEAGRNINAVFGLLPESRAQHEAEQSAAYASYLASIQRAREGRLTHGSTAVHTGGPTVGLGYDEIQRQLTRDVGAFESGAISRAEFHRRYNQLTAEENSSAEILIASYGHKPQDIKRANERLAAVLNATRVAYLEAAQSNRTSDPFRDIASAGLGHVANRADLLGQQDKIFGTGKGLDYSLRGLTYYTTRIAQRGKQNDPKVLEQIGKLQADAQASIQKYVDDANAAVGRIPKGADGKLSASGARQAERIFDNTLARLRKAQQDSRLRVTQISARVGKEQSEISSLEQLRRSTPEERVRIAEHTGQPVDIKAIDARITRLRGAYKKDQSALHAMELAVAEFGKALLTAISEITGARQQTASEQASAAADAVQKHLQEIQLQGDVSTSAIQTLGKAGDRQRLQSQLSTAQRVLSAARQGGTHDDILQAEVQVNDLRRQLADSVKSDAKDVHDLALQLYESEVALKLAGVTGPLQRDRIQLRGDVGSLKRIHRGDFDTAIEYQIARNQQLAKVRGDRSSLQQDVIGEDIAQANFQHDIGKLSDDAYVRQLKSILHMKKITTETKRQLLSEIYHLEHDNTGSLDLSVGNIKLPTAYEIRRSVAAAQAGPNITQSYALTVHVTRAEDVPKVAAATERMFRGSTRAIRRASGHLGGV